MIQMTENKFRNYARFAEAMQYHKVPYYSSNTKLYRVDKLNFVFYKCPFIDCFKVTRIFKRPKPRTRVNHSQIETDPIIQFARCDYNKIE